MVDSSGQISADIAGIADGGESALADWFTENRERLIRIIYFRMDQRLLGRLDVDDLLQESFINAAKRLDHYLENPKGSVLVWVRMVINQTLIDFHRRHIGADKRDARRERTIHGGYSPDATSMSLAIQLLGNFTSPSHAAMREEEAADVRNAIDEMDEIDREVLALRHYEELTNSEIAEILDISPASASIRYVRALEKLKSHVKRMK